MLFADSGNPLAWISMDTDPAAALACTSARPSALKSARLRPWLWLDHETRRDAG
jgi:hypothetical protein